MNGTPNYSDEIISAFVDGELGDAERQQLLAAVAGSDELRRRICNVAQLKELVKAAYPETGGRDPGDDASGSWRRFTRYALAASLVLASLAGVLTLQWHGPAEALFGDDLLRTVALDSGRDQQTSRTRVVFHVSSADPEAARDLLDQVELVLQEYAGSNRPLKVEVVANNQGLRLLQQGRSPVAERIRKLDERYQNLLFAACGNTLERLRRETGEQIRILPQAVIVQSGVSFVARRQQEGWAYIKV